MKWKFVNLKGIKNLLIFLPISTLIFVIITNLLAYTDNDIQYLRGTSFFATFKILGGLAISMMLAVFFLETSLFFPIDVYQIKNDKYIFSHNYIVLFIKLLFFISIFVLFGYYSKLYPEDPIYEQRRSTYRIIFIISVVLAILFCIWVIFKYVYNKISNRKDFLSISKDELNWFDNETGEKSVARTEIDSIILKEDKIGLNSIFISLNNKPENAVIIELQNLRLIPHQIKIKSVMKELYGDLIQED
jgi:hypothetical protein